MKKTNMKQNEVPTGAVTTVEIGALRADGHNANKGTERGRQALADSLKKYGAGRSIVIDKHGAIIGGNKTIEQAQAAGIKDVVVVETDGSQIVAVKRTDLDLSRDAKARELAYADNRTGELNLDWDPDVIRADVDLGLELPGFDPEELEALMHHPDEDENDGAGGGSAAEKYEVVITCKNQREQKRLLNRLNRDGYTCKAKG
jgi:hypothetical protein